ncbi:pyridine nucleotide-disulfide oxidoreductase [Burkholderiales bacterium GJ-E10]|nr:pyridine nucleotide-disulfide oxidoreductase [Burkholderiales bacterium GJ-E10]
MKILIVGGGMGGTILANNLARRLSHEIKTKKVRLTMLSASDRHMYQPGLLYVALGRASTDELYRDQASLLEPGIEFHVDPVEEFDLDKNRVKTKSGRTFDYDLIAIATGSRAVPEEIPGLAEHSINVYTEEAALKFWKTINAFRGGRIVISAGVPHKCPMIPPELTFTLYDFFRDRGLADKVSIHYTYPIGRLHSLEPVGKWMQGEFDQRGITSETLFNMKEVDGEKKVIRSIEGAETPFDLLVAVPGHKGMEVIEKNNLGKGGWIPVNRNRLNIEGRENAFALGDTTNLPISKAGSTAHFEAEALAENLAAIVKIGSPVRDYDGKVFCFIEAGKDKATYAMFNYTTPPDPKPPTKSIHWFKMAYNQLYWASARGLL